MFLLRECERAVMTYAEPRLREQRWTALPCSPPKAGAGASARPSAFALLRWGDPGPLVPLFVFLCLIPVPFIFFLPLFNPMELFSF